MPVPVYILAGGRSTRFGADKARAVVRGRPLLLHVVEAATEVASSITVVAAATGAYDDLGLRTIADLQGGRGPLGGLHAALGDPRRGGDWLLLTSCDWVGLRAAWLEALCAARTADAGAVAFRGERWQPLPALYHARLLGEVERRVAEGPRALWRLIADSAPVALPLPEDFSSALPINSPADLPPR
jgi:molybdenum cofactor guanylyltransferase